MHILFIFWSFSYNVLRKAETILPRIFFMLRLLSGFFLFLFLLIWGCSENPVELQDPSLVEPVYETQVFVDTLYATFDTTYLTQPMVSTLESNRILVGSGEGMTFRPILKFSFIPSGFKVTHAELQFPTLEAIGDAPQAFEVTAYPVTEEWTDNTDSIWADYAAVVDYTRPMGSMTITPEADDTLTLVLTDTTLLNFWADSSGYEQNHGFILDFNSANFVKALQANNFMQLSFILKGETEEKQDSATIVDAFLVQGDYPLIPGRNYVSTLKPRATVLTFDLTPLAQKYPNNIDVSSANLQMSVDWDNTLMDNDFKAALQILRLRSDPASSTVEVDSTQTDPVQGFFVDFTRISDDSTFIEISSGQERVELARNYVQREIVDPDAFTGFLIQFRNRVDLMSYFAFLKRNEVDKAKRPRLILEYVVYPSSRF